MLSGVGYLAVQTLISLELSQFIGKTAWLHMKLRLNNCSTFFVTCHYISNTLWRRAWGWQQQHWWLPCFPEGSIVKSTCSFRRPTTNLFIFSNDSHSVTVIMVTDTVTQVEVKKQYYFLLRTGQTLWSQFWKKKRVYSYSTISILYNKRSSLHRHSTAHLTIPISVIRLGLGLGFLYK